MLEPPHVIPVHTITALARGEIKITPVVGIYPFTFMLGHQAFIVIAFIILLFSLRIVIWIIFKIFRN
jgi:hypothetical protein